MPGKQSKRCRADFTAALYEVATVARNHLGMSHEDILKDVKDILELVDREEADCSELMANCSELMAKLDVLGRQ